MRLSLTLTIVAALFATTAGGQDAAPQERAAAIKQSLAQNQAALRQYTWVETTEISLKGEVKKKEQKQCRYGADGKVQKTPLPGAAPAPAAPKKEGRSGRGGRVKEKVVENKVEDLKDYMEQVAALVQQYVPPDPQKIQAAQSAGTLQPSAGGLTVKDYAKPGDAVMIGFDPAAKKLSSYRVTSYVEKPKDDEVTLAVTFAALRRWNELPSTGGARRHGEEDSSEGDELRAHEIGAIASFCYDVRRAHHVATPCRVRLGRHCGVQCRRRRRSRANRAAQKAPLPDACRLVQAFQPRTGGSRGHRVREGWRLRRDDARGLQAGFGEAGHVVPDAGVPRAVRRPDADDQRQPAADRRCRSGRSSTTSATARRWLACTVPRSRCTTIPSSARCWAATIAGRSCRPTWSVRRSAC